MLQIMMALIGINFICSFLYVMGEFRSTLSVLQAQANIANKSLNTAAVASAIGIGELRFPETKPRENQVGTSRSKFNSKRYHEAEKAKYTPYPHSSENTRPAKSTNGKVSYEVKVYVPKNEATGEVVSMEKQASEVVPVAVAGRYEPSVELISFPYVLEERGYSSPKYDLQKVPSYFRPFRGGPPKGSSYEVKLPYYMPVYADELIAPERTSQQSSREAETAKIRYIDPYHPSSVEQIKPSEEPVRPVSYVEVKTIKMGEPAFPPSYKPKQDRDKHSATADSSLSHDLPSPQSRQVDLTPDYVPYDQQQTTDPPQSSSEKEVYYEKTVPVAAPEAVTYEQRSRAPYHSKGYGPSYYPPPPPPPYYYYMYPAQQPYHGQHHGGGYQHHGSHYKHNPRPIYSGYGYAAYAPY